MSDLPIHPIHGEANIKTFDVFIAGSGPVGATYARLLVDAGYSVPQALIYSFSFLVNRTCLQVLMAEIGDQDTRLPAEHKKNEIKYQKNIDSFVSVVQAALSTVSTPISSTVIPTLDPAAWTAEKREDMFITNRRNPAQDDYNNLGGAGVSRCVGGMSTHWTCSTPEFLKGIERPVILTSKTNGVDDDDAEWDRLYAAAKKLIGTDSTQFDKSIRHNLVLEALQKAYPERNVKAIPLACHRLDEESPYVFWHAASNIFGDMWTNPNKENSNGRKRGYFTLLTNTRCTKLHLNPNSTTGHDIAFVEVRDLLKSGVEKQDLAEIWDRLKRGVPEKDIDKVRELLNRGVQEKDFAINAKIFVLAASAFGTPQILANSGFGGLRVPSNLKPGDPINPKDDLKHLRLVPGYPIIPNLGIRISEQVLAFCQVVMLKSVVEKVDDKDRPLWWQKAVTAQRIAHPNDPIHIPVEDPEPHVFIPVHPDRKWHTQIHRDAFSYGEVGPQVDHRIVVDLRSFGMQEPDPNNRLIFEIDYSDGFGMPQPTFEYRSTDKSALEAHDMITDMSEMASKIGGSSPQFLTPGLAYHLGGSVRLGQGADIETTVANFNSQVWGFKNLYVAGNGVIPTAYAANPTLTSMCLAIRSAYQIHEHLESGEFPAAAKTDVMTKTPDTWLSWATNKADPNYPDHIGRKVHRHV
ncbi:putative pyranose oxidase [Mycena floridula]|nr:putative pyranose oxidase [Mycena floridula]